MEFLEELTAIAKNMESIQGDDLNIDMLQPLIDLGYLTLTQCKPENQHRKTFLEIAVKQFRKDYESYQSQIRRFTFEPFEKEHYHRYKTSLNEVEMIFIQKAVSFEGDFVLAELPPFGKVTLASRIVHYRLEMFGLYGKSANHGVDAPFTDESLAELQILKSFLRWEAIDDATILNWLGELNVLIDRIFEVLNRDTNRDKKNIYFDKNGVFDTTQLIDTPVNTILCYYDFMTRLFQIYLWANGWYHGAIDGIVKISDGKNLHQFSVEKTIDELVECLNYYEDIILIKKEQEQREEREDEEDEADEPEGKARGAGGDRRKERRLRRQMRRQIRRNKEFKTSFFYGEATWNEGMFWLNVINILKYTKALQSNDNSRSITAIIDENDKKIKEEEHKISRQIFQKNGHLTDLVKENLTLRKENFLNGTNRKIYYGIQQFKKVFRRILEGFFKKMDTFFKRIFNIVKRIAIIVYKEVKAGIKVFIHGFSFLVGKRSIVTRANITENMPEAEEHNLLEKIVTIFDLDCDARQFINSNVTEAEIKSHNEKCRNQVNSLKISLVVTAIVLKWILYLATSNVSWAGILLMMGKTLKQRRLIG
jgi:hypothetical protein